MKPRGSIENFGLILAIVGVIAAGSGLPDAHLPMISLTTTKKSIAPRSLELALGEVMSQGLTDLDELFFLPPEAFLMALTTYFRTLRDQKAFADEIFLLLKRFLYEYSSVNTQLRILPHLPKGLLKHSLVAHLKAFAKQFGEATAIPAVVTADQLRQLIQPAQLVLIKDAYTENYLVENQGLFRRLTEAFFGQAGPLTGPKLVERTRNFLGQLQYLRCINASQNKLFAGIFEGLIAAEENSDNNISQFRAKADQFINSLLDNSYLAGRVRTLDQLVLPSTRADLAS